MYKNKMTAHRTKIADEMVNEPEHWLKQRIYNCPRGRQWIVEQGAQRQSKNKPLLFYLAASLLQ